MARTVNPASCKWIAFAHVIPDKHLILENWYIANLIKEGCIGIEEHRYGHVREQFCVLNEACILIHGMADDSYCLFCKFRGQGLIYHQSPGRLRNIRHADEIDISEIAQDQVFTFRLCTLMKDFDQLAEIVPLLDPFPRSAHGRNCPRVGANGCLDIVGGNAKKFNGSWVYFAKNCRIRQNT